MTTKSRDISGDIGDLFPVSPTALSCPMYSFGRAAHLFWQGFYDGLIEDGYTDEQAMEWLQSKSARWMLDNQGDQIEALGKQIALTKKAF